MKAHRLNMDKYRKYVVLHKLGKTDVEISSIIGISRQTLSKWRKGLRSDCIEMAITKLEKRLELLAMDNESKPNDLVKVSDALSKLYAIQRKKMQI